MLNGNGIQMEYKNHFDLLISEAMKLLLICLYTIHEQPLNFSHLNANKEKNSIFCRVNER